MCALLPYRGRPRSAMPDSPKERSRLDRDWSGEKATVDMLAIFILEW
jgi:hypothetical protein